MTQEIFAWKHSRRGVGGRKRIRTVVQSRLIFRMPCSRLREGFWQRLAFRCLVDGHTLHDHNIGAWARMNRGVQVSGLC